MDQKELKTTTKQRIVIAIIAVLLLASTIATYILIVVSSSNSGEAKMSKLQEQYRAKQTEINEYGATLSNKYFNTMNKYRSEVKAYNAESVNSSGIKKTDLQEGDGRELTTGDLNYFAYYIGWCADETIFDATFNNKDNPTSLTVPIYAGQGLIEGWNEGVVGMKIGGVREVAIPGELAYGDTKEICGGTNSPLKFIIMPVADEKLFTLNDELENIYGELVQAYYSSSAANRGTSSTTNTTSGVNSGTVGGSSDATATPSNAE
ncbi:FKBP-type peptidyl-prolyl cis-trans isomerase [Candidatus Saccharibacteria bacterium]|nr:FKBP-type peptidyl-prolyl cis-trans isomerase [Candidatus Saccharibacteria bacterium]